ncbi:P-loop containing nucleoside triphosphate hydrolase protein [Xylaria arbuscula]|nr:P-loop containing nucleoside triphosphate hydrolase protein [Xylaria arbuscula]
MMEPPEITVSRPTSPDLPSLAIRNHDQSDCSSFIFDDSSCDSPPTDGSLSSTSNISREDKTFKPTISLAKKEWDDRKIQNDEENEFIDELMEYEGLEEVKRQFLDIKSMVEVSKHIGYRFSSGMFNIVLRGNPGTGKTTIARLYGNFLKSLHVLPVVHWTQEELSGMQGPQQIEQKLTDMITPTELGETSGGILIIDEADQLVSPYTSSFGRSALDIILTFMEKEVDKLAIAFVGYKDEMEALFQHNPGLSSRISYSMNFKDFTNYELWMILCKQLACQWKKGIEVEQGYGELYMRCTIRRLGAGRGRKGFGNARAVQNLLSHIAQRQARRLVQEVQRGKTPDYHLLTKEDVLGPDPSKALDTSEAFSELQKLIGLEKVKENVKALINSMKMNYWRELHEIQPLRISLNQVFVGRPGTGKTTVARLYGRILADLGFLSHKEVIFKTVADFIGDCLGMSELLTKNILEASIGRVLVIDEAYMLDPGSSIKDYNQYKAGIIDTIVSIVQGQQHEDRCIILVGYEDKIRTMFHNANPGLSRRFPNDPSQVFRFDDFTIEQLELILRSKIRDRDLACTDAALAAAREIFNSALATGNSTNVGIVDRALDTAIMNYMKRVSETNDKDPNPKIQAVDFNPKISKALKVDYRMNMEGRIHHSLINQLMRYQNIYQMAKRRGVSIEKAQLIPTRILFRGSPGTGKTTMAKCMSKLFFDMGYISTPDIIEYSATEFIGQYLGQTRYMTREKLTNALSRFLVINDVHHLLDGLFETQALNEVARFLSQPATDRNIVVVLSGDDKTINELMKRHNISAVFRDIIVFENLSPDDCTNLLGRELECIGFQKGAQFARNSDSSEYGKIGKLFFEMQSMVSWNNAHDVKHLARQAMGRFIELDNLDGDERKDLPTSIIVDCMQEFITRQSELKARSGSQESLQDKKRYVERSRGSDPYTVPRRRESISPSPPHAPLSSSYRPISELSTDTGKQSVMEMNTSEAWKPAASFAPQNVRTRVEAEQPCRIRREEIENNMEETPARREEGVSDTVWNQVQKLIEDEKNEQGTLEELDEKLQEAGDALVRGTRDQRKTLQKSYDQVHALYSDYNLRLQHKQKVKRVLKKMGICELGHVWRSDVESGGYRCEGGSHFVANEVINNMSEYED